MNHIVDTCPLTKFEGGLNLLHEADDDAVIWLESTATAALAKWMIIAIADTPRNQYSTNIRHAGCETTTTMQGSTIHRSVKHS